MPKRTRINAPLRRRMTVLVLGIGLAASSVVATAAPVAAAPSVAPVAAAAGRPTTPVVTAAAVADPNDGSFGIAVMPDTQQEVLNAGDTRFTNRVQWLVRHKAGFDLRYITHVGDVVNWDTADHAQYKATVPGVKLLDASGIPWSFSIGNHDSQATGPGGSARPGGNAAVDMRVTTTFNSYFGVSHDSALIGTYEPGKIDNSYSMFLAEGKRFLVLNLELWPRTGAVAWAQQVVAGHPNANVIIVTHAMLNADGTIQQDAGGYGANSPQYVVDNLVRKYANVRLVFSGHAGTFALRNLDGVHGNPVSIVQTTYHSNDTNPVRMVTINTRTNVYTSRVYAPYTGQWLTDGSATSRGHMAWV